METAPITDPLEFAQKALGCREGLTIDREEKQVLSFCEEHDPPCCEEHDPDYWPCIASERLAAQIRERDEHQQRFYREREQYFASLFGVADAGKYRADWDGAVERWKAEQQSIGEERAMELMRPEYSDAIKMIRIRLDREKEGR